MRPRHFVVATAGHVDHGKSALVKALSGTDPDRLPEEKARGITIDLGFAHLRMRTPDGEQIVVGIVDVPGHEDFVRNMIAGVGSIDLALLMVAVDDGWMPQTEEHLQILLYLGVTRLIVALTKVDLGNAAQAEAQVRQHLAGTAFSGCPIIATSATAGTGLLELKEAIRGALSLGITARDHDKPRLCIDRAFTLRGLGTIVTGTLAHGSLRRGQSVVIQPGHLTSRIRSVQTYGQDVELAPPGARTALNLPDISLGAGVNAIKRGDVITTLPGDPSSLVDILLEISDRSFAPRSRSRLLRNGTIVDIHHGTARVPSKIRLHEHDSLGRGEKSLARLHLTGPLLAFVGDRLILRDRSQQNTLAGGIVLDPAPGRWSLRDPAQQTLLLARAVGWNDVDCCVASEIARDKIVNLAGFLQKSPFADRAIQESLRRLQARGEIIILRDVAAEPATWETLRNRAIDLIDRSHSDHPEKGGLNLSALRSTFRDLSAEALHLLVVDLENDGFTRDGQLIARQAHRAVLPTALEPIAAQIREALTAKPFDPPSRKTIAPDQKTEQALRFLITEGSVTEVSSEVVVLHEPLERMKEGIRSFISNHGPATASQLRQELNTSRRIIIPLLEYLDRAGLTRRVGDQRILAKSD